jgi:hypothetical protein
MRFVFQCFVIVLAVLGAAPLAHSEQIFGDFGQPAWSRMFKYFEPRFGAIAKDETQVYLCGDRRRASRCTKND